VPPVIYSIPRNSPLHYVTYVRVYDSTSDVVYVGYTPGYVGSYLSADNVIVYGTGWYYSPWVGSVWYGAPVTWGFGFTIFNSWWNPWWRPWGPAWGFAHAPVPCLHPWWGPWHRQVPRVAVGAVPLQRRAVAPINANGGAVRNFNRPAVNVSHLYGRWGSNVVLATSRPRAAPPLVSAVPITGGARNRTPTTMPPAMARPAQPAQAQSTVRAAQTAVQSGADVVSSSDGRVYRRAGGQWQRFTGNGNWQNVGISNSAQPEGNARVGAANPAGVPATPGHVPPAARAPSMGGQRFPGNRNWQNMGRSNSAPPEVNARVGAANPVGVPPTTGHVPPGSRGASTGAMRASPVGVQPSPAAVQSSPAIAPVRVRPFSHTTAAPSSFPSQQREAPPMHAPMSSAGPGAPRFESSPMPRASGPAGAGPGAAGTGRNSSFAHGRDASTPSRGQVSSSQNMSGRGFAGR